MASSSSSSSITALYDIKGAKEHLYNVKILDKTILTTVTKHAPAVTEWITSISAGNLVHHCVGFEVELITDPDQDDSYIIATVQLCVGSHCLVLQILRMSEYSTSLDQFLSDPNKTFYGVDIEIKMNMLTDQYRYLSAAEGPVKYRDVGDLAANVFNKPELSEATQSELFERAFDRELELPSVDENDWGRRDKLSNAQVLYACIEAFASFELGRRLTTPNN